MRECRAGRRTARTARPARQGPRWGGPLGKFLLRRLTHAVLVLLATSFLAAVALTEMGDPFTQAGDHTPRSTSSGTSRAFE